MKGLLPLILLGVLLIPIPLSAYQKGIALGLYSKEKNYSYQNDLREIRATGADHVSLVVSWYQKDVHATEIYPIHRGRGDFETLSDKKISEVIRQAHGAGLKVLLFPILRIEERREKEWRGSLTPKDLDRWLKSYRRFTLHYAHLAARLGVELFAVGSELCSVEKEERFWRDLISQIRQFYRGDLLYSANWDHYAKIEFWDALDYLGLNGYYELTTSQSPTIQEITRRWWDIENELASWQDRHHKQIVFTEIGYPSMDGACGKPWDYTREAPVDLNEQAVCYEAFFRSWARSSKLGGVYLWNWYGQGGPDDRSYTPRGKPAERVLTKWFRDSSSPSSQSSSPPAEAPVKRPTSQQARSPSF